MTRIAVVGATGYAGAELVRILSGHPQVRLALLTSRQYAGVPIERVFPALTGRASLECEVYDAEQIQERADVVFTALPHKLPMALVPELIAAGKRVIDLSADFRFRNADVYEAHYQAHTARELLSESVYGLSELYTAAIRSARLVGNPGCYPTSVLMPLVPLLREKLISPEGLIADSKSGVSGAGRSLALAAHFCEVNESFKPYKVGAHRHTPEMEEVLSAEAGQSVGLTFVPHLVPMTRGMQTTLYVRPAPGVNAAAVRDCLVAAFAGRSFIRIRKEGQAPDSLHVRGTNYCDIGFVFEQRNQRLILMSAIDNLVKGAAGQAVQNMNIMLGLEETLGLDTVGYPI